MAKARLRVILANLAGQISVADACADLGIEESWFFELKHESLQRWVKTLEPGSPGRPPSAEKRPNKSRSRIWKDKFGALGAGAEGGPIARGVGARGSVSAQAAGRSKPQKKRRR